MREVSARGDDESERQGRLCQEQGAKPFYLADCLCAHSARVLASERCAGEPVRSDVGGDRRRAGIFPCFDPVDVERVDGKDIPVRWISFRGTGSAIARLAEIRVAVSNPWHEF